MEEKISKLTEEIVELRQSNVLLSQQISALGEDREDHEADDSLFIMVSIF